MEEELKKLEQRISALEEEGKDINSNFHIHSGIDMPKIKVRNLDSVLYAEATLNPGELVDAAGTTLAVTVTGCQFGDFSLSAAPYDLVDMTMTSYVATTNSVEIRIQNESGATVDLASGLWRVLVIKRLI